MAWLPETVTAVFIWPLIGWPMIFPSLSRPSSPFSWPSLSSSLACRSGIRQSWSRRRRPTPRVSRSRLEGAGHCREIVELVLAGHVGIASRVHGDTVADVTATAAEVGGVNSYRAGGI